jgi:RNA polymerase sigma factor (sigma-70 family)
MTTYDPVLTAAAFASLDAHPLIIHGAMKACRIAEFDLDYPDLLAEARLQYVEAYCELQTDADTPQFQTQQQLNYLYTAVLWHLKNVLRAQRHRTYHHPATEHVPERLKSQQSPHRHQQMLNNRLLLAELTEQLTPEEQHFLWLCWVERRPFEELTEIFHCSRRKLFYLQGRIQKLIDGVKTEQ